MTNVARNCPHCGLQLPDAASSGGLPADCPHCAKPLGEPAGPEPRQSPPAPPSPSQDSQPTLLELTLDDVVTRPPAPPAPAALGPPDATRPAWQAPPEPSYPAQPYAAPGAGWGPQPAAPSVSCLSEADLTHRPVSRPSPATGFSAWALDFLLFRVQIATPLIIVAWLLTWCATIYAALLYSGLASKVPGPSPSLQTAAYWVGVALVLILQRVFFEWLAVVLLINDTSTELMRIVEKLLGGTETTASSPSRVFWDFLNLRTFAFVPLTVVVWAGGTAALVFLSFFDFGLPSVFLRAIGTLAAVVLWRVVCEVFVVWFRIGQTLAPLKRDDAPGPEEDVVQRFFSFRTLIMPSLVRLVWYAAIVGAALVVATPWVPVNRFLPRGAGLPVAIGALVVIRLACEMSIVAFGIHESLWALKRTVSHAYPNVNPAPRRAPGYLFFRGMILKGFLILAWLLGSFVIVAGPAIVGLAGRGGMAGLHAGPGGTEAWRETLPYTIPLALGALVAFRLVFEQLLLVFLLNDATSEAVALVSAVPGEGRTEGRSYWLDFLRFRETWAPHVIQVVWILALLGFVVTAVWCLNAAMLMREGERAMAGVVFLVDIGALLVSRFVCELGIVIFCVYANLRYICRKLGAAPSV